MRAKLGRGRYRIVEEQIHGICDYMSRTISIDARERGRNYLDTLVHECLHASNPKLSEAVVTRMANEISRVLWHKGYRKRDE